MKPPWLFCPLILQTKWLPQIAIHYPVQRTKNRVGKLVFEYLFAEPLDWFNLLLIELTSELVDFSASPLPSYIVSCTSLFGYQQQAQSYTGSICLHLREVGASAPSNLLLLQPKPLHCVLGYLVSYRQLVLSFIILMLALRFIPTGLSNSCTSLPLSE